MSTRPKIQLAKRTIPTTSSQAADVTTGHEEGIFKDGQSHKAKSNPFGEATAADTASRLEAIEIKGRHSKAQQEEPKDKVASTEGETGDKMVDTNGDHTNEATTADGEKTMEKRERRDRNQRRKEPRAINPRAAFLADAPGASSGPSGRNREERDRRGPAPVVNERFAKLAAEDREHFQRRDEKRMERRGGDRGPPPVQNSRFAKATEKDEDYVRPSERRSMGHREIGEGGGEDKRMERRGGDRGPPPVQNSRFAKAIEDDEDYVPPSERRSMGHRERGEGGDRRGEDRGPPPVQNSRFAKAIEEDQDYVPPSHRHSMGHRERGEGTDRRGGDRGPPPVQNSRFAKAIEEDQDYVPPSQRHRERGEGRFGAGEDRDRLQDFEPRGPPPVVQNSRFAAAAAEMEKEREAEMREREERRMMRGHGRDRMDMAPPPIPTNSRFAAAAADYEVEREREVREREERRAERHRQYDDRPEGGGRYGDRYGDDGSRPSGGRFGDRAGRGLQADPFPPLDKTRTTFIKPELPAHLQPKKVEEPVLPPVEAPLALPGEDEEAARARIEKKKREEEEKRLAEQKAAEEAAAKKAAEEAEAAEKARKAAEMEGLLLDTFVNSGKFGDDLKVWCQEQGSILPSIEKLVFHLLITTQKDDPNPQCPWAEPAKYGTALSSLVEDNVIGMTEILFAIQRFCNEIGFPKIGSEGLIQAMFRNMYKFDLADDEAFSMWKDDESNEREVGKGKSIIQTMDWFNWLEEEEEESEEDYED